MSTTNIEAQNIANLITIRQFLNNSIDNISIKMSNADIKELQARIRHLDETIFKNALKFDLNPKVVIERKFATSIDIDAVKTVEDLDSNSTFTTSEPVEQIPASKEFVETMENMGADPKFVEAMKKEAEEKIKKSKKK